MVSKTGRALCRFVSTVILIFALLLLPIRSDARGLIRDAEIEATMLRVTAPIFRAAGLSPSQVKIYIVDAPRMNAFVAGGNNIFINTGLLRRLKTLDQLRSVIAHEAGHITGGHLAIRGGVVRQARGVAAIGILVALAAAAAGSGEAALAAGAGSAELARRGVLAHSRADEAAADQAGIRYMIAAGADPRAALEVMRLFEGQDILSNRRVDPYVRTHPLWSERIRYLRDRVANAPKPKAPDRADAYWHGRMVAKFDGFIGSPQRVLRQYKGVNTEAGALARAVAYHRLPNIRRAMREVDALIKARPKDPFYRELKGQFLLENGKAAEAVKQLRQAAALAPKEGLILGELGRALVALDTPKATNEALGILQKSRGLDPANPRTLRNLALAYGRVGRTADAALATAQRFALQGRLRDASVHARRAAAAFPEGSAGWRQAQDILRAAGQAGK